jgi:LPXTG-motif cell wall-anchored protein
MTSRRALRVLLAAALAVLTASTCFSVITDMIWPRGTPAWAVRASDATWLGAVLLVAAAGLILWRRQRESAGGAS